MAVSSSIAPLVLVTREDPAPVSQAVRVAGGEALELPLLTTRWLDFELPHRLEDYDWVAFTSPRALAAILARAEAEKWSWPPDVAVAAVGDRTAHELQAHGWMPDCVSEDQSAGGLAACLRTRRIRGARVLFPCSAVAEPTFPDGARAAGASVDVLHVYATEPVWEREPEQKSVLAQRLAAALGRGCVPTCASPSAARALAELAREAGAWEQLLRAPIVVMGPTTARAVRALGLTAVDSGGRSLAAMARKAVEIGGRGASTTR